MTNVTNDEHDDQHLTPLLPHNLIRLKIQSVNWEHTRRPGDYDDGDGDKNDDDDDNDRNDDAAADDDDDKDNDDDDDDDFY